MPLRWSARRERYPRERGPGAAHAADALPQAANLRCAFGLRGMVPGRQGRPPDKRTLSVDLSAARENMVSEGATVRWLKRQNGKRQT